MRYIQFQLVLNVDVPQDVVWRTNVFADITMRSGHGVTGCSRDGALCTTEVCRILEGSRILIVAKHDHRYGWKFFERLERIFEQLAFRMRLMLP